MNDSLELFRIFVIDWVALGHGVLPKVHAVPVVRETKKCLHLEEPLAEEHREKYGFAPTKRYNKQRSPHLPAFFYSESEAKQFLLHNMTQQLAWAEQKVADCKAGLAQLQAELVEVEQAVAHDDGKACYRFVDACEKSEVPR